MPTLGDWADIEAPRLLAMSAVDSSCRIASLIHKKKSEITTGEVLDRLEKEIKIAVRSC
jgi:hypothetical protein